MDAGVHVGAGVRVVGVGAANRLLLTLGFGSAHLTNWNLNIQRRLSLDENCAWLAEFFQLTCVHDDVVDAIVQLGHTSSMCDAKDSCVAF